MFTLLPSLYLVAVHYIRQWNRPYYYEQTQEEEQQHQKNNPNEISKKTSIIEALEKSDSSLLQLKILDQSRSDQSNEKHHPKSNIDINDENRSNPMKIRTKQVSRSSSSINVERCKTYTGDLHENDILYLMNETDFTREQILLWHSDFLVSFCFFTSIITLNHKRYFLFLFQRDCPDGKLSKSKFIDIYKQFYKKGQVAKFCEHAFRVFDKDGSGFIGKFQTKFK